MTQIYESKHRRRQARQGATLGSSRWAQVVAFVAFAMAGIAVLATVTIAARGF